MNDGTKNRMSRRQLLKGGVAAGAGMLLPWSAALAGSTKKASGVRQPSSKGSARVQANPPYSGPLPASVAQLSALSNNANLFYSAPLIASIPVAAPRFRQGGVNHYQMEMKEGSFKFHPAFPVASRTWGYDDGNGGYIGYLGPTFEVLIKETLMVKWVNSLPADPSGPLGLADPNLIPPELQSIGGRAVVHVHGGHNPSVYDGGPENSFPPGQFRTYQYDNLQDEASLWYHDHAMGVTRLNAYVGLAGLYFIRGNIEFRNNWPVKDYEIPLILQDKAFSVEGNAINLWYYKPWNMEFFGNVNMVNGQLWPVLHVEPRRYRFRIYNATQARFYNLRLTTSAPTQTTAWGKSADLPFYQIGAEGGFLPAVAVMNELLVGNGERADVIVDFSSYKDQSVYLANDASTPYDPDFPLLASDPESPTGTLFPTEPVINMMQVMKFVVDKPLVRPAGSFVPVAGKAVNRGFKKIDPATAAQWRQITLVEQPYAPGDVNGDPGNLVTVNNRAFSMAGANITETPKLGTTEVWQFVNMTPDFHPMHMHLVTFQVVGRQRLSAATTPPGPDDPEYKKYRYGSEGNGNQISPTGALTGSPYVTGPIEDPLPNESGFKDTVKTPPGWVTYVVAKFTDYVGKFVYHCHILDHEENDMMQYMDVHPRFGKEDAEPQGTIPTEYTLEQNYPNPFNPSTQIRFQVPQDGHVSLTVFNTAGQEVAKLVDANMSAGAHVVSWNANGVASGAYFYRLEAGTFSAVKKMVLMK